MTGLCVVNPIQFVQRVSKNGSAATSGRTIATSPSGQRHTPHATVKRTTISSSAIACSTPKLMKLVGNIAHEPSETSSAQPAICATRLQKRASDCPCAAAMPCPAPTHSMKSVTMQARCTVQTGER